MSPKHCEMERRVLPAIRRPNRGPVSDEHDERRQGAEPRARMEQALPGRARHLQDRVAVAEEVGDHLEKKRREI